MTKRVLYVLLALVIIGVTFALSRYWLTNKPHADRVAAKPLMPLAEIIKPDSMDHQTTVYGMGAVIPSQSVNLTPRISGMVISISPNFIEGGLLKKGEALVELDPTDYLLAIKQSENDLAKAQFNLKLEMGQQAIARREFELLGSELSAKERELVLRQPHLNAAKAALAAAEASLKLAHLNLQRTKPFAPFNAIITQRNANLGAWMPAFSTGTPLARLVGTDSFWINASLPVDKLSWIDIPGINSQQGSPVKITNDSDWGKGVYRTGRVKRLQAELEPEGRMAKLIVEIDDPLNQKAVNKRLPSLMLGAYVRVEIAGKTLTDVVKLPETLLHEGESVWLMTDKKTLDIRKVDFLWREQGFIYLDRQQLPEDSRVISSDIAVPVQGMSLRLPTKNDKPAVAAIAAH